MPAKPNKPSPTVRPRCPDRDCQSRAITATEFLSDCVRISYFCHRPWGSADEHAVIDLPYASLRDLPAPSADHGHGEFRETWEESVYVPPCDATVILRFAKWQETDDCRMEGLVGGPYLALGSGPS